MTTASQRDVVFTPLMLRVRETLDGAGDPPAPRLQPSVARGVAQAIDEWFYLRCRCEQVLAEANAMLGGRADPLDLDDEFGTGRLGFTFGSRRRSVYISLGQAGRTGWVELTRSYAPDDPQPVEPESPDVLEDLAVEIIASEIRTSEQGEQR